VPSLTCPYPTAGSFTARGVITDKDQGSRTYTTEVAVLTAHEALKVLQKEVKSQSKLSKEQGKVLLLVKVPHLTRA